MELYQRTSFNQNELISQDEDHIYEFKYFAKSSENSPINEYNLLRTICGMLNCFGGYIFIGIRQDQANFDVKRYAVGYYLNEYEKEEYRKYINSLSKRFYPKVDTSEMDIVVKYIPILSEQQGNKNKYIIRLTVQKGNPQYFFSFKHKCQQLSFDINLFFKRYDNETKQVCQMSEIYTEILKRSSEAGAATPPQVAQVRRLANQISLPPESQCKILNFKEENDNKNLQIPEGQKIDDRTIIPKPQLNENHQLTKKIAHSSQPQIKQNLSKSMINNEDSKDEISSELNKTSTFHKEIIKNEKEPQQLFCDINKVIHTPKIAYNKTVVKGLHAKHTETFEKHLKKFKRLRTKIQNIEGRPKYCINFGTFDQHQRFVNFFKQNPLEDAELQYEVI